MNSDNFNKIFEFISNSKSNKTWFKKELSNTKKRIDKIREGVDDEIN